jgi:hypothetical protein
MALGFARPARALLPVILAAATAITVLAGATGKAAEALDYAVKKTDKLLADIVGAKRAASARREIEEREKMLRMSMRERRKVIHREYRTEETRGALVTRMESYGESRDPDSWHSLVSAINRAVFVLGFMAKVLREKAVWFPAAAQDSLSELPKVYKKGVSIIYRLSKEAPPHTDEEFRAWTRLVEAYDGLRRQSLKLVKALEMYTMQE